MGKKKLTKGKKKSSKSSKDKKPTSKEFNNARLELKKMIDILSSEELTPTWPNSSSNSSEKKSTQKIEELEKHIEGLETKINLLSKLVIYHGPGAPNQKGNWGNNSFHKMLELFPEETKYYYDKINRETSYKHIDIHTLKERHNGQNRDDDILGQLPPTNPHSRYKNKNWV
tara:strand:- start:79 stop:591 length:513 start_codon:yes stop_codon:yes gene_type:complete